MILNTVPGKYEMEGSWAYNRFILVQCSALSSVDFSRSLGLEF